VTKLLALILTCVALGLVAAGCGGDDDNGGGGGAGGGDGGAANGGGGAGGGGVEVSIEAFQFMPADVTVAPGETITFTNNEDIAHDVHKSAGPGKDFGSGPTGGLKRGDTFELTLDEPGSYEYVCNMHSPGMVGEIVVK
jgi:plastocyanin